MPTPADINFEARLRVELKRRAAVMPAMVHSIDENGRLTSVSDTWLAKLGYAREEVLGRLLLDFLTPESRDYAVREVLPEFFRTGRCEDVRYRMVRKDGGIIDVLLSAVLRSDPFGRGCVSLAVITDVSALARTKRKLAESEARYRFLAENSADLIILVGQDGKRTYASPACERLLGFTPEEMLALNTRDAIHPDDADRVLSVLGSDERMRATRTISYRMRRKDGDYVWVETTGRPVDAEGRTKQRLVLVRDIEQRRLAEERLKDSESRYRLLADNSSDMVFQLDHDLVRRYVSPACRELLGYEPEEMLGIKPLGMAHPEDAARLELMFQSLMNGSVERQSIINRIRHRDGRWIWVEAQLRALKDTENDAIIGIIGALRDISARKAIEDELGEANRRLQILAAQDGLTGLANRRAFNEALAKEHLRARREKAALALIMIDVDRFKNFNDIYGHPAGDDCLRRVAAALTETIHRPGDLVARYGGEEFAVLLPGTDEDGAAVIGERIGKAILGLGIPHDANGCGVVTVSAGVASIACADQASERLVENADHALYRAKHSGRNAVKRATEAMASTAAGASSAA